MKSSKRLYIAYGSNMNLTQMARRCPNAKLIGKTELEDYELLFRGNRSSAVATIEPKKGSRVPVLIWELSALDEEALDIYEGYPRLYDKTMLDVKIGKEIVCSMVYIMTPGHSFGVPSESYRRIIEEGYRSAEIDTGILEQAVKEAYELSGQDQEPLISGTMLGIR